MTYAEAPTTTTLKFIPSWQNQDPNRLAAELISVSQETHRQPDVYVFGFENGILIDPETKRPVLDFIAKDNEYIIAEKLQEWAGKNEEGISYWISPRSEKYPCDKIIVHRIAYTWSGEKVVLNCAILFEANLENPEKLRNTFFTSEDTEENLQGILNWIENISQKKIEINDQVITREQAIYFAERILNGESRYSIVEEMQSRGFLGKHSVSCASGSKTQSFSDLIVNQFSPSYEFHLGTCRICGNTTEVGPCSICRTCEKKF